MHFDWGVWTAALFTLGIFSFLYRDNQLYKFCEAVFIGISAGYYVVKTFKDTMVPKLLLPVGLADGHFEKLLTSDALVLVPATVMGIMILMRLVPKVGWLSRYPMAFIVGLSAGTGIVYTAQSNLVMQLAGTVAPLFDGSLMDVVGHIVVLVGVISVLLYFFYSVEHTGVYGPISKVGIYFLMVSFGASFGYTVMGRVSLLIGRMHFLLHDWLGVAQ